MKTEVELTVTKIDDNIAPVGSPKLKVTSHWNNPALINIQFDGSKIISVSAKELTMAIENATNNT
jgi:hypothetical protein